MKKTIGIVTDDTDKDPSIYVFLSLQKKYDCNIKTINPLLPFNKNDFIDVNILYHRISGRGQKIVDQKYDFYLKAIEETKLPFIGNLTNLRQIKNKFNQIKEAKLSGLKTPKTVFIENNSTPEVYVGDLTYPLILKCVYSLGGSDVHLIRDENDLKRQIVEGEKYLIQEFIHLDEIIDYRAYVVGNQVVGGIIRKNETEGEFRANTTMGASVKFFLPDDELSRLALSYVKHLGAEILAVDFIRKAGEYYFIESNDAFSVKIDNEPRKIIVAESIIKYCLAKIGEK